MDDDTAARRSIVGVGGLASLCCLGPGTAAVTGGVAASGMGAGLVETAVLALALVIAVFALRRRTGCAGCETDCVPDS
ncbi:hypothetical protein [Natronobeatus ordinarius]|uniref:hypothetical protein n=1 Tax=Natronobeatus ordinarius TaxID=2963433 RepID=UPI0020CC00AA|nr:hypothetical protein [Natronobeatus ordinarius]